MSSARRCTLSWYLAAGVLFLLGLVASGRRWIWLVPLGAGVVWAVEGLRRDAYSDSGHALEFSVLLVAYAMLPFVIGYLLRFLVGRLVGPVSWPGDRIG